jgi:hypothetical protein
VVGPVERDVIAFARMSGRNGPRDWRCPFSVDGIDEPCDQVAYGLDGLQALLLAIEGARAVLDKSGLTLTWHGGEPGDVGIPRMVPPSLGASFARRIETYIDRQVRAFAKAAKARRQSRW